MHLQTILPFPISPLFKQADIIVQTVIIQLLMRAKFQKDRSTECCWEFHGIAYLFALSILLEIRKIQAVVCGTPSPAFA